MLQEVTDPFQLPTPDYTTHNTDHDHSEVETLRTWSARSSTTMSSVAMASSVSDMPHSQPDRHIQDHGILYNPRVPNSNSTQISGSGSPAVSFAEHDPEGFMPSNNIGSINVALYNICTTPACNDPYCRTHQTFDMTMDYYLTGIGDNFVVMHEDILDVYVEDIAVEDTVSQDEAGNTYL